MTNVTAAYNVTDEAADGLVLGRLLADLTGGALEVFQVLTEGEGDDHDSMRRSARTIQANRRPR